MKTLFERMAETQTVQTIPKFGQQDSRRCECGNVIEPQRVAWSYPTCWDCAGRGCGAEWKDGQPVRRCDACDCQPPA